MKKLNKKCLNKFKKNKSVIVLTKNQKKNINGGVSKVFSDIFTGVDDFTEIVL